MSLAHLATSSCEPVTATSSALSGSPRSSISASSSSISYGMSSPLIHLPTCVAAMSSLAASSLWLQDSLFIAKCTSFWLLDCIELPPGWFANYRRRRRKRLDRRRQALALARRRTKREGKKKSGSIPILFFSRKRLQPQLDRE